MVCNIQIINFYVNQVLISNIWKMIKNSYKDVGDQDVKDGHKVRICVGLSFYSKEQLTAIGVQTF